MASTSPLKQYTTYLTYAGISLAVLSAFGQYLWTDNMHLLWPVILLFIVGIQWLVMAFVMKFAQHKTQTMLKQYQIAKMVKLFVFIIVMGTYVFAVNDKSNVLNFLMNFIAYYFVFFVLETWFFQRWANALPRTPDKTV